jgi:hypothetical protein
MAEAQPALEESAQRIAKRGRQVLLERLRGAFEEAAAAHSDVLELDEAKLERMIADAVERADGLQWRRALASVATEELGLGLAEALSHPAVARAQELVGAPSYEEGLAAIAEGKAPQAGDARALEEAPEPGAETEAETEAQAPPADPHVLPISVGVVHLDGLAELEGQGELELVFSDEGLDVVRTGAAAALVSFSWTELRDVEVHAGRGRVLRRRSSRLILSTNRRRARFEARGLDPEELRQLLAPALAKVGGER